MKKLEQYDLIKNDIFYRGVHILEYIRNKNLTELDIEAIKATIMDALVYKKLIDPSKQFLDFDNLCIVDEKHENCYEYESTPFVCGIPLWIKEEARKHFPAIAGNSPTSVFMSRPANEFVRFCVYDINTSLSVIFDDFAFLQCEYDSPTRPHKRAEQRPFLQANISGIPYLFDLLTKRIFMKNKFEKKYNMVTTYQIYKKDFDEERKKYYEEQITEERSGYGTFLSFSIPFLEPLKSVDVWQEYLYEIEKSKELYPEAFVDADEITKDMESFYKGKQFILSKKEDQNN